jgi:carbonic anhydrase
MTATDDLLRNAESYAKTFDRGELPLPPAKHVAIVACMDARLNVYGLRSLAISQRLLATKEIVLIHHTDCGMLTFSDDDFRRQLIEETGVEPAWDAETFSDLAVDVRESIARIRDSPFIPEKGSIRGFVYDVHTGRLDEVT